MSKFAGQVLDMQNRYLTNVPDPSSAQHAATKNYVDGIVRGLDWKPEVVAASTGNVSLASPGTSLDGVTLSAGMQTIPGIGTVTRILLKDQTAPAENGIYDWTGSAAALTRSQDADSNIELSGSTVTVQRGTVNADRVYRVTTDDPITLGTTGITWVQVGAGSTTYTGSTGVSVSGTAITGVVKASGGVLVDSSLGFYLDNTYVVRKYATSIGNGALTSITVTHNLGSTDIQVQLWDNTTKEQYQLYDVVYVDANSITLSFPTAPASNAYRVLVQG